jgi:hypothetical protein
MDVCEAKRLKALEEGNTRLKKLLPDRNAGRGGAPGAFRKKW